MQWATVLNSFEFIPWTYNDPHLDVNNLVFMTMFLGYEAGACSMTITPLPWNFDLSPIIHSQAIICGTSSYDVNSYEKQPSLTHISLCGDFLLDVTFLSIFISIFVLDCKCVTVCSSLGLSVPSLVGSLVGSPSLWDGSSNNSMSSGLIGCRIKWIILAAAQIQNAPTNAKSNPQPVAPASQYKKAWSSSLPSKMMLWTFIPSRVLMLVTAGNDMSAAGVHPILMFPVLQMFSSVATITPTTAW